MAEAPHLGVVRPSYGAFRRTLFPFYAADQLIFLAIAAIPFIWIATVDSGLALYAGVGGYVGVVITMQRSTPSSLLLAREQERHAIELLDESSFLRRTRNGLEWLNTRGRLSRWSTDTIRLERTTAGVLVTGRLIDLQAIANELCN